MPKVLNKKGLIKAMTGARKFQKAVTNDEEDVAWREWTDACNETFGDTIKSLNASRMKSLTRELHWCKNETVIKVFEALGYEIK